MTKAIFEEWVESVFEPHLSHKRGELDLWGEPALLWVDAHPSRRSARALEFLRDNNIVVATIPAHASHVVQPLIVA